MLCLSTYFNPLLKTNKINVLVLIIFRGNRMVCYLQPEMLTLTVKLKRQRVQFCGTEICGGVIPIVYFGEFWGLKSRRLANLCRNIRKLRYKLYNLLALSITIILSQNFMLSFYCSSQNFRILCDKNFSLTILFNYIESLPVIWVPKAWFPLCSSRSIFVFGIIYIFAINLM
jgi:hypothetical protein